MKFWDMVYTRYSDPIPLLNHLIMQGKLSEFLVEMEEQINEEKLWELYLHGGILTGKSFMDWCEEESPPQEQKTFSGKKFDVGATVTDSETILNGFTPF